MKTIGKRSAAVLLSMIMIVLAAACGEKKPSATQAPETAAQTEASYTATKAPETGAPTEKETEQETTVPETTAETEPEKEEDISPLHLYLGVHERGSFDQEEYYRKTFASITTLELSEEDSEKYPGLAKSLESYSRGQESGLYEIISDLGEAYYSSAQYRDMTEIYLSSENSTSVMRADSNVLSVTVSNYQYWGGAHPDQYYRTLNFDSKTGKQLEIGDVVSDTEKLIELADEKLKTEYEEMYPYMEDPAKYMRDKGFDGEGLVWGLGHDRLTLYFNTYELGSYAMGSQLIDIYFEDSPGIFYEKYTAAGDSYVIPAELDRVYHLDVNGDGKREDISITKTWEPGYEEFSYAWEVTSGGRSLTTMYAYYSGTPYIVKNGDKYYMYIFGVSDNDYSILTVVDLMKMELDEERCINASFVRTYDDHIYEDSFFENTYIEPVFTDINEFGLWSKVDYMSTISGIKTYHVGSDGWPESDDAFFRAITGIILRAKKDVECELADGAGHVTGKSVIKEGTYLYFVRTDNETFMDFQEAALSIVEEIDNGYSVMLYTKDRPDPDYTKPVYRITETRDEWPRLVNGEPEEDVFDGIAYAG